MHTEGHKLYRESAEMTIGSLRAENSELRFQVRELNNTLTNLAKSRDEEATKRLNADSDRLALERTLDRAFGTLGNVADVAMAAKFGLDPGAMEALKSISANKKLMAALKDPKVSKLLEDEETQEYIADLLATAAHAPAQVEQTPPAETATPTPPPDGAVPAEPDASEPVVEPVAEPAKADARDAQMFDHPLPDLPADFMETE